MTNTSRCVERQFVWLLAMRNLKGNNVQSMAIITCVAIVCVLFSTVMNFGTSIAKTMEFNKIQNCGTSAEIKLVSPTDEQYEIAKNLSYVESAGMEIDLGNVKISDYEVQAVYSDVSQWENHIAPTIVNFEGRYPTELDEVIISKNILSKLGIDKIKLGMSIRLEDKQTKREFTLTGTYDDYKSYDLVQPSKIYFSEKYVEELSFSSEEDGTLFLTINKNPILENLNMLSNIIGSQGIFNNPYSKTDDLTRDLKISAEQKLERALNAPTLSYDVNSMIVSYALVIVPILICGYILISNCFVLSLRKDIRQYGMLKTIGAEYSQIKRMTYYQGFCLFSVGAVIGFVLGIPASTWIIPSVIKDFLSFEYTKPVLSIMPISYVLTFVFVLLTVLLGCQKAVTKVKNLSADEANRYIGKKASNKLNHNLNIASMSRANVLQNLRAALPTIIILCLGATIYLCASTMSKSMNPQSHARYVTSGHSFKIEYLGHGEDNDKKHEAFSELLSKLKDVEGINQITTLTHARFLLNFIDKANANDVKEVDDYRIFNSTKEGNVWGIDSSHLEGVVLQGDEPFDIEAFERGETALLNYGACETYPQNTILGGNISGGIEKEFTVSGYVPDKFRSNLYTSGYPEIYVSNKALSNLGVAILDELYIDIDENYDSDIISRQISAFIKPYPAFNIYESEKLQRETLKVQSQVLMLGGILGGLLVTIGIIGFIIMLIINFEVRKPEFKTMWSIGMTKLQLKKMIFTESIYYSVIAGVLILVIGNVLALGFYMLFSSQATYAVYIYPIKELMLSICIVIGSIIFSSKYLTNKIVTIK